MMKRILAIAVVILFALGILPALAGGASWGFSYTGQMTASGDPGGVLGHTTGVAVDKFGNTYVVGDSQDIVNIYNPAGTLTDTWGSTGTGNGQLDAPVDVEVDRWGNVYVLEDGNQRITVFNPAGSFTRHISGPGPSVSNLFNPLGIGVSLDGDVYVCDNATQIKKFTTFNTFVTSWDPDGHPFGITCDQDGGVWVANDQAVPSAPLYGNTVMKYSPWGVIEESWGSTGTADGEFDRAYDVSVDGGGRVFVLDSNGGRVQAFDSTGNFLTKYTGTGATPDTLWWPYGVSAGYKREFRVADWGYNRIVAFKSDPVIPTKLSGVAGTTRYKTAEAVAQLGWPENAEYALVATALNWPDALSGAGLAGASGGPLLLTNPDTLSPEVASEIARLNCDQVYVLGGPAAVSSSVYSALEGIMGAGNVHRLGGSNRYETSALIANQAVALLGGSYDGTGIVVTGQNFPDALAVSPIAAANAWPILLTEPDALPTVIKTAMTSNNINHGYVIGGATAVGGDAFDDIDALWIGSPYRVSGSNRYSTAAAVAELGYTGLGMLWSRPALATGEDFPDALAGGVLQGSDCSVMLLTPSDSLDPAAAAALTKYRDSIYELRYLGGTAVLEPAVRSASAALLH